MGGWQLARCLFLLNALMGASMLDRVGKRPVLIDDDYTRAAATGNEIVRGKAA